MSMAQSLSKVYTVIGTKDENLICEKVSCGGHRLVRRNGSLM